MTGVEGRNGEGRNVYIARGGRRRKVVNEEEIIGMVKKMGWKICNGEKMSFQEQIDTMRNADLIVGAHGAGMTNMVFATNARVLEIFPSDHIVPNCYDHLAERCGHEYYWLVSGQLGSEDHFSIHPKRFMNAVDILCS
jgi:capsular polysaccharide biosynthesis protein